MSHPRAFFLLLLLLLCPRGVWAQSSEPRPPASKPPERAVSLELVTGLRFDNNAFLDRRGQFGADAVPHLVSVLGFNTDLSFNLKKWLTFGVRAEILSEELRVDLKEKGLTDDLRRSSLNLTPRLELAPRSWLKLSFSPGLEVTRESDSAWSYLQIQPLVEMSLTTFFGLTTELEYAYTGKFYDSSEPTETYANVDLQGHRVQLGFKQWFARFMRGRLTAGFERQTFEDNIGVLLGKIVFLPIDRFEDPSATFTPILRKDWTVRLEGETLFVPFKWGAAAAGYRYEEVLSNMDPFTYRGHGPRLAFAFSMKGHEAYVEGKLTFRDYYNFRFDTRYEDKKKDFKLDVYASYGYVITRWVRLDAVYSFLRNDSNDALYFAFGHSRSYSLYQRSKIELKATFAFDFSYSKPVTRPDIPGTILADRVRQKDRR